MLEKLLSDRALPQLKSREEMKEILLREEYGEQPTEPFSVIMGTPADIEKRLDGGNCVLSRVDMTISTQYGTHSFPVHRLLHTDGKKRPFFVFLNTYSAVPSLYFPAELIADNGFDVLSVCYREVTSDNNDFTDGIAGLLLPDGQDTPHTCGKIGLWAWCASRLLDYAETLPCLDLSQAAVIGHSRLGKTALVAGMLDTRFSYTFSNCAGCAGDSIARGSLGVLNGKGKWGGKGENIEAITSAFGYWFNKNYKRYAETGIPDGFDQHYLLATIAPRFVHIASSDMDDWADPVSQQLCCLAAGKMWENNYSLPGLVHNDRILNADEALLAGRVGYHRRSGNHFLSYRDWQLDMDYIRMHQADSRI